MIEAGKHSTIRQLFGSLVIFEVWSGLGSRARINRSATAMTGSPLSASGGNVGIGFAVPTNMARLVMTQLIATGEVKRGQIGVTLRKQNLARSEADRSADVEGAVVDSVEPQSPAAQAGVAKGDIITAANNVRIRSPSQFRNVVGLTPVGSQIQLQLRRGKEIVAAAVQIEALKQKRSDQHALRN